MGKTALHSISKLDGLERLLFLLMVNEELSASGLAARLGVSTVTVARMVASLRSRGIKVRSIREPGKWHYEITEMEGFFRDRWRKALERHRERLVGVKIEEQRQLAGKSVDDVVYGNLTSVPRATGRMAELARTR